MKKKHWIIILWLMVVLLMAIGVPQLYYYAKSQTTLSKPDPILFGATYMTMNNPFFEVIDDEMRNVIESNGDIMLTMDPQLSLTRQIEQIHYLMDQGCQILIINPVDSNGLLEVLQEAKAKGIYIIAVDTNVYNGNDVVDYTVVSDNYKAGVLCAKDMMQKKTSADIFILKHETAYSAVERIQGFKDTIAAMPQYRIVDEVECEGQLEKSMPVIEKALNASLAFDVVMALNDPSALGAIAALQEKQVLDQVDVYGIDGTPEAKVLIKEGYMKGSVAQYPKKMAKKAVESAYQLLLHTSKTTEEKVDVNMIDVQNVNDYSLEGWQ